MRVKERGERGREEEDLLSSSIIFTVAMLGLRVTKSSAVTQTENDLSWSSAEASIVLMSTQCSVLVALKISISAKGTIR